MTTKTNNLISKYFQIHAFRKVFAEIQKGGAIMAPFLCIMTQSRSTVKVSFVELFYDNNALSYSTAMNILRGCHGSR